ncbi:hypothetical protein [Kingella oralis]|jgi:hypothetical protein|uniref:hypothetical protein n=1 Tax=Kingella oralis TaxID=505 RepID=UPI0034E47A99
MKERGYLLGAVPRFREASEGVKGFDFCLVTVAFSNGLGGLVGVEYVYGKSSNDAKAVNAIVSNAGGVPVAAEFDLSQERDYKTGKNVLRLNNFVVLK